MKLSVPIGTAKLSIASTMHPWQIWYGPLEAARNPLVMGSPHRRHRSDAVSEGFDGTFCLASICFAASPRHSKQALPVRPATRWAFDPQRAHGMAVMVKFLSR